MVGLPPPDLTIVSLNYNRLQDTAYCLERIRESIRDRTDIEVVAVDNASEDGTGAYLQSQSHWLTPVFMDRNLGIAGYNHGFARARGRIILVLDDDSFPKNSHTLDCILHTLDSRPEVGAVACRIECPNGQRRVSWHLPPEDAFGPSMAFVGCGFAVRRELFAEIGWYPEEYFLYQNDVYVALKIRQQGYGIVFDPQCRVVHLESAAGRKSWRRVFYPTRNSLWLIRTFAPRIWIPYLLLSRILLGLARGGQFRALGVWADAVQQGLCARVSRNTVKSAQQKEFAELWKQNSIVHQLIRLLRRTSPKF